MTRDRTGHADRIARAAIAAADPGAAVLTALLDAELPGDRIHLLAIGKAAATMSSAALTALAARGNTPASLLVVVPHDATVPDDLRAHVLSAAHPVPDATSERAAVRVEQLIAEVRDDDAIIVLLSGGASSLCAAPMGDITITEYAGVVSALIRAGASIGEVNTVRANIDRLKGGGMARLLRPARTLALVVSDVIGSPLDIIASGPLTPPGTTTPDAVRVLEMYGLWETGPASVRRLLALPREHLHDAAAFAHVTTRIVLDNRAAIDGAAREAERLGYDVRMLQEPVTGSARDAGVRLARTALTAADAMPPGSTPVCMLAGGETTVVVIGDGVGGRNQELVLAAAIEIAGDSRVTVASIGTDGVDGPTDAAGAIADGSSVERGSDRGVMAEHALDRNDSHTFFEAIGSLVRTGPTGTNVMDVQIALIDPPR